MKAAQGFTQKQATSNKREWRSDSRQGPGRAILNTFDRRLGKKQQKHGRPPTT